MCSCNYFYTVGSCGMPMEIFPCKNCGNNIGGTNHKIFQRPGHVKIINDNELNDGNCKYLKQLMNEVENERRKQFKGFHKVKYEFFMKNKKVRNISNITYRILSFIFYSCIYWSEKLEFLNRNNIQNFYFINGNTQNNDIFYFKSNMENFNRRINKKRSE